MIKILHGADFHLDSPFDSLPEEKAVRRRAEQRQLVSDMVRLAEAERVDAIVLSGDLLDSGRSYHETGEVLTEAFGRVKIPVFIAPGNHDYYSVNSPWAVLKFPSNVYIFKSVMPEKVDLPGCAGTIWGAAFTAAGSVPVLPEKENLDPARVNIMAVHGTVGGPDGRYNPISEPDIARTGLDYLALGHVHTYGGLQRAGDTFWAYPGCPEGRGFDETGQKGVLITELEKGAARCRFVPLGKRAYMILQADLSGAEAYEAVLAAVLAAIPEADGGGNICRILLTGEFSGRLDLIKLEEAVADRFFHVTIRDNTKIKRDIWAQAEEDTLKGLFLRKMRDRYDAGDEAVRKQVIYAVRYALAAMEHGEEWRT